MQIRAGHGKKPGPLEPWFTIHCTGGVSNMGTELKVGIQGRGSSTVSDLSILAGLLENQTGIRMSPALQDSIVLKMEWLKNGNIDCM
jgi:hypothetical protein